VEVTAKSFTSCSATPTDDAIVDLSETLSDSVGGAAAVIVTDTAADTVSAVVGPALGVGVKTMVGIGTGLEVGSTKSAQHRPRPTALVVGEQLGAAPAPLLEDIE
jgi:hypothetical protein